MFSSLSVLSAIATPCSIHDNVLSAAGDEGGGGFDAELRYLEDVSKGKPLDWISGSPVANEHGRFQIIKNDDLEELQELGDGTSGTVYHGKWRGSDVAIEIINDKCFAGKPSEQEEMQNDFWNEASNLVDLHQPNVLAFYGVVLGGPGGSIATVTEYMHICIDYSWMIHVRDLGLLNMKCQTLISGGVRGTLPRMATELLNGSSSLVTEKVDVFFFGIVLWELLTGEEPYADLHYGVIIAYLLPFVEINDNEEQVLATEACSTGTHEPIYLSR